MNNKDLVRYMKWIEQYTAQYKVLDIGNRGNSENYKKLERLYTTIKKYAEKNYIECIVMSDGDTYNEILYISYNNNVYEIGFYLNTNNVYFCKRVDVEKSVTVIECENVFNNIILETTHIKAKKLKELSELVQELTNLDIPYKNISTTMHDSYVKTKNKIN